MDFAVVNARTFGAKFRRGRPKIARICVRFGAILVRTTRASVAERVQLLSGVVANLADEVDTEFLNVRCVPREKFTKFCTRIAREQFCRGTELNRVFVSK